MTPSKSSYLKAFALFLLMVVLPTALVVIVKLHLPFNETASSTISFILKGALILLYLYAWRWLSKRLKSIEGKRP